MKSIAVIGQGFVGGTLTTVFSEHGFKVYVYDKSGKIATGGIDLCVNKYVSDDSYDEQTRAYKGKLSLAGFAVERSIQGLVKSCESLDDFSRVYFVCVPTPMFEDGEADLSIVEQVLSDLSLVPGNRIAVVKSTVPPGSTERWNEKFKETGLRVIFNPEFLTEANALDDMRNQNRIILGGPRPHINVVKLIFQKAFPKVPLVKTSSTTAEMIKYFTNVQLASRVVLSCELSQVCDALDKSGLNVDYDKVVEYAKYDHRLGGSHMNVPGPEGIPGAAGHCIIKGTSVMTKTGYVLVENLLVGQTLISSDHLLSDVESKNVDVISCNDYDGDVFTFKTIVNDVEHSVTCTPEHILPIIRNNILMLLEAKYIVNSDKIFVCSENNDLLSIHMCMVKHQNVEIICKMCQAVTFVEYKCRHRVFCNRKCVELFQKGKNNPSYGKTYRTKLTHPEWAEKVSKTHKIRAHILGDKNPMKNPVTANKMGKSRSRRFQTDEKFREKTAELVRNAWRDGKYDGVQVGKCKWFSFTKSDGIICKVQGTWELAYAKWLDSNGTKFVAHRGRLPYVDANNVKRNYYPDFYLLDEDKFIDVKNVYHYNLSKEKWKHIYEHNPNIKIDILFHEDLKKLGVL